MRKKMIAAALCLCLTVMAAGCGKDTTKGEGVPTPSDGTTQTTPTAETTGTSDGTQEDGTEVSLTLEQKYIDGVTLGAYFGIEVERATAEEIEDYISDALADNVIRTEVTDRAVKNGDVTIIDYAGYRGDEQFDGGTATDAELVIGSGTFIDGFESGLIGAEIGKEVSLNLTFPESYREESLAGQDVVFKVTVKQIFEETLPELTDEFVQGISDCKTVEEYRQYVTDDINEQKSYNAVRTAVIKNADISLYPEENIAATAESMKSQYQLYASYYGLDYATFLLYFFGMTEDAFNEQMDAYAKQLEEERMVFLKVAQQENLSLSEEEFAKQTLELAQNYGYETAEEFEADYGREVIEESLLLEAALKLCIENAVLVDTVQEQ